MNATSSGDNDRSLGNVCHVRKTAEFVTIKEIFPGIEDGIIERVLLGHNYSVQKTTDALQALVSSLKTTAITKEKGEQQHSATSTDDYSQEKNSISIISDNVGGSDSISKSPKVQHTTKPMLKGVPVEDATGTDPLSMASISMRPLPPPPVASMNLSPASTRRLTRNIKNYRGTKMTLPFSFLKVPRHHLRIDRKNDFSTDFTISFHRKNEKLGITIHEVNSDIVLYALYRKEFGRTLLAEEAGVRVGDILSGINYEYFSPGAEIQDVLDILTHAGDYVTLHFTRRHKAAAGKLDGSSFHSSIKLFIEHNVIEPSQAEYVDRAIKRLKDRTLQWNSGWISQRLENWKLESYLYNPSSTSSGAHSKRPLLILRNSMRRRSENNIKAALAAEEEATATAVAAAEGSLATSSVDESRGLSRTEAAQRRRASFREGKTDSTDKLISDSFRNTMSLEDRRKSDSSFRNKRISQGGGLEAIKAGLIDGGSSGFSARGLGPTAGDDNDDLMVPTKDLRPSLSVRILRAEQERDYVSYVIWVLDVKSGVEWIVRRRFREFWEFREFLISQRQGVRGIDFPPKKINVIETALIVAERVKLLQKFLRKISSMVVVNSLHPSTARIQIGLQRFLNVDDRIESIILGEAREDSSTVRAVQVYVHNVMQMAVMDKVISGFIDNFVEPNMAVDIVKDWKEEEGIAVADDLKGFIDHLQSFLYSCLFDDCLEIIERHTRKEATIGGGLDASKFDGSSGVSKGMKALKKINPRNIKLLSSSQKIIEELAASSRDDQHGGDTNDNNRGVVPEHHWNWSSDEAKSIMAARKSMMQTLVHLNEDELRNIVRIAIRRQVEVEIYVGCSGRLHYVLQKAFALSEMKMWEKISMVAHEPQSYFGIPIQHISPSSWEPVVEQLRELRSKTLPIDRIEGLLRVAKEIPRVYQDEHPLAEKPLGADDILPIFIYIIVKAQVPSILALNQEMQSLCDPDNKLSETGYYLATLEASLQHLLDADVALNIGSDSLFPFLNSSSTPRKSALSFSTTDDKNDDQCPWDRVDIVDSDAPAADDDSGGSGEVETAAPPLATDDVDNVAVVTRMNVNHQFID